MQSNNGHIAEPPAWFFEPDNQFSAPPTNGAAAQATEPALVPDVFPPLSFEGLITRPPKQWIINQIIGPRDLAMIYGTPGCGKTFVVIDLIFAACLGKMFAMRFDIDRPLNVAYAAGEGMGGLPQRFKAAASFYGVDTMPNFTFFENIPQLYNTSATAHKHSIITFVKEYKERQEKGEAQPLDILIIDTLHSATVGADENSGQDMGIVLQALKWAAEELGCAIIVIHHTNKSGLDERGHSSLRGDMDSLIKLHRVSDNGSLSIMSATKIKDGDNWKDQSFDLIEMEDSVRIWWNEPSDAATSKGREKEHKAAMIGFLLAHPTQKFTAKMLGEVAGISQSQAIKLLARMVEGAECSSELQDITKAASSRNPLTYLVR